MEFKKYQHVERFGTTEVEGIEIGVTYVFPKIDGTNSSVWFGCDGLVHAGSRTRELSADKDNAGFYAYVCENEHLSLLLNENPNLRLYGEWLVPHSLKTYRDECWRYFYVFDVMMEDTNGEERYLPYEEYKPIMEKYGIEYIPPIAVIQNAGYDSFVSKLSANVFLIKDGQGCGEGIVIKRYDYANKYGKTIWAKIVTSEFKEKHSRVMGGQVEKAKSMVEDLIADKYVTEALCEKVYAKIVNDKGDWKSQYIPMLLNMVYYDVVNEECWNFVKEHKNPIINFRTLSVFVSNRVKSIMSRIF